MNENKESSKDMNKKIFFISLVYTTSFFVITILLPILGSLNGEQPLSKILVNTLKFSPLVFILMYLVSGSQILLLLWVLKKLYKNNFLDFMKLKTIKTKSIAVILTIVWLVINFIIWSTINSIKLG